MSADLKQQNLRPLVVQKYGGMSLATAAQIKTAAKRVAHLRAAGNNVIAVVSAMGATTDALVDLAYSVSRKPNRRELDMLLSTGERVSMALFSMALTDALSELVPEAKAISFTGSQAGILTDETHSNAKIIDVKSTRVKEALDRGDVVILAGFQGVSPLTKEITTLGRGGTDVTAVAFAAAFKAERCEILKEVPGVLSADPKLVANVRPIDDLTHDQLLDLTFWGAKVLHYRSVELAATHGVSLRVGLAHDTDLSAQKKSQFTRVERNQNPMMNEAKNQTTFENEKLIAVTSHSDVRLCSVKAETVAHGLKIFEQAISRQNLPLPQILDISFDKSVSILMTAPSEVLEAQIKAISSVPNLIVNSEKFSTVTATCQGSYTTDFSLRLIQCLEAQAIFPIRVFMGPLSVTFLMRQSQRAESVNALHSYST